MENIIKYEKLEDFLGLLKANADKKNPVYVDVIRLTQETGLLSMKISFMFLQNGFLHQCFYDDDMPEMYLIQNDVFARFSTPELQKMTHDDYLLSLKNFDDMMKAEYQKAESIIKGMGFVVVMGVVQLAARSQVTS